VKKVTIDDITMTECCMIMTGFGEVWEHDNHTYGNSEGMRNKYITLIVSCVGYVNCKHAKGWENEKGKIKFVLELI